MIGTQLNNLGRHGAGARTAMQTDELTPGTLVRYDETTTRWYIATVRSVDGDTVTLEYLGGYLEGVERAKVSSLKNFLRGREKVLSRKREDLCHLLYGRQFDRLPQSRLEEMQKLLLKLEFVRNPRLVLVSKRLRNPGVRERNLLLAGLPPVGKCVMRSFTVE